MSDSMSESDIHKEMDFWINYTQPIKDFKHKNFYVNFFDFSQIKNEVLEIGCGGSPFITYVDNYDSSIQLSLLDPLIDQISSIPKYSFLTNYTRYNQNLLDSSINQKYDYIVCLNVLDHFPDSYTNFLDKIKHMLKDSGKIFLYYDIRRINNDGHYAINHNEVYNYIINNFKIIKESLDVNPVHHNWSTVYQSYRALLGVDAVS
jgi:2-polyprenyl-3-methyl-5-hydroxy-6-metoxy-1,4-benzoquinol methylase